MACVSAVAPAAFFPRPPCSVPPYRPPCSTVLSPSSQPFQPCRVMVRWQPPRAGWFKLNFDGSVYHDGSGRASVGGAIRDCDGRILLAFAEPTEHATVGVVEARALIRGLRFALECFVDRLLVEGDELVLVQLLRREETQTRIPLAMQEEIITLLGCFSECEVQHVYREGNQVAHVLCREAYERPGVWMGGLVPRAVWEKAHDDRHGVAHERPRKAARVSDSWTSRGLLGARRQESQATRASSSAAAGRPGRALERGGVSCELRPIRVCGDRSFVQDRQFGMAGIWCIH